MENLELESPQPHYTPDLPQSSETEHAHAGDHIHDHTHAHETNTPLSLLEEIKLEAAQSSGRTAKGAELQAACGCGSCPQCLTITVWNIGSLVAPAIKVMARRRRDRAH